MSLGSFSLTADNMSSDVFVARLGKGGTVDWAVSAGGPKDDAAGAIWVDPWGNSAIAGIHRTNAKFGKTILGGTGFTNIFIARLDRFGKF